MNPASDESGYRPPQDCPVCASRLHTSRLGCTHCGTELSGHFRTCAFCALSERDLDLLRVFLASRGTMRDLERHLGVSYPTARARFEEVLGKLGLRPAEGPRTAPGPPSSDRSPGDAPSTGGSPTDGPPAREPGHGATPDPRLRALHALAAGDLDVQAARRLIE